MSTQKRRVIYMSDQEWTELAREAKERGLTISALIRNAITKNGGTKRDGTR